MTLGVVAQRGNERAVSLAGRIRAAVGTEAVRVDEATGDALDIGGVPLDALAPADLIVSIGGDGTFLFAARHVADTPLVGVNLGEVGFLTALAPKDAVPTLRRLHEDARADRLTVRTVPRIVARCGDETVDPALNELMVHAPRRGTGDRMRAEVRIDGATYDCRRVDGVMVAPPTGSTAYNLSERGPLVAPGIDALVVNQMCARNGRPPLVVPGDAEVSIAVEDAPYAHLIGDGRTQHRIEVPATVRITRSETPLRLAGPPVDFYDALDKLA